MKFVLILSRSVLSEEKLRRNLEFLGYEVFCSASVLNELLISKGSKWLNLFQIVILSETVSDVEMNHLLSIFGSKKLRVYRIENDPFEKSVIEEWEKLGVNGWLETQSSLTELRESLSENMSQLPDENLQQYFGEGAVDKNYQFELFFKTLSNKERELMSILYQNDGKVISREEVTEAVWGGEVTQSQLAQLSQITRKIREKMTRFSIDNRCLETSWGKGYSLSKEFCEEVNYLNQQQSVMPFRNETIT